MKTKIYQSVCLFVVATLLCTPKMAEALLAGIKTSGMAATSTAYPVDAFAGAYNPAVITDLENRLDTGVTWVQDYQRLKISGNENPLNLELNSSRDAAKTPDVYVPEFAITKTMFGKPCSPFSVNGSFLVYNRNFLKTTYTRPIELLGSSPAGLEYLHQTASAILAFCFFQTQSIGLSLNFNVQRLKVNGLEYAAAPFFPLTLVFAGSTNPNKATNKGYEYSTGLGVTVGYFGKFFDCLQIGLAYQPEGKMTKFHKYKGFIADGGKFNIPWRLQAGIAYQLSCSLAFAFDYEYVHWQTIRMLKNPTFPNLTDDLLGSHNGAGFGWKNQHFFRFGVDWAASRFWNLRFGFRHTKTPVRHAFTAVNLLTMDVVENFATMGATYRINRCHEISILYAIGFVNRFKGKESIPVLLGGGETDLKEGKHALGLSWGYLY